MSRFLTYSIGFLLLLFLQEYVLSAINILGLVNIFAYITIIILLPLSVPRAWLLVLGFCVGYIMDTMSGAGGLNAICVVWLAFVRPMVADMTLGRDVVLAGVIPSAYRVGASRFLSYTALMCLLFVTPYFLLEMMTLNDVWYTVIRILISSALTTALIFVLHLPFNRNG